MSSLSLDTIKKLPKTDLHLHLDGSLRIPTIIELAKQNSVSLPSTNPKELFEHIYAGETCHSLEDYLRAFFEILLPVLQTEESLVRATREIAEDSHQEGARYVEIRYCPHLHANKGMPHKTSIEAVHEGMKQAKDKWGIEARIVLAILRHDMTIKEALEIAELCCEHKDLGVVAIDIAGAEDGYPPKRFKEAFDLAINNGVGCTIHAGEGYGSDSIKQAVHDCGAMRIGHGTNLYQDPELQTYVAQNNIALEACVTSNVQTRVAKNWADHPVKQYIKQGITITINTDNRLVSHTTLSDELWGCHRHFNWGTTEIRQVLLAGFEHAFLPEENKTRLLTEAARDIDQIFNSL